MERPSADETTPSWNAGLLNAGLGGGAASQALLRSAGLGRTRRIRQISMMEPGMKPGGKVRITKDWRTGSSSIPLTTQGWCIMFKRLRLQRAARRDAEVLQPEGGVTERQAMNTVMPDSVLAHAEGALSRFCARRVPVDLRDKMRLGWATEGASLTLIERRPHFRCPSEWTESMVAMFRYDGEAETWSLFCCDRDSRWHAYPEFDSVADFEALLDEIDADPTGIFWG